MTFEQWTKLASIVGAILVALWATITYYDSLRKPFNDMQLLLCKEASEAAAALASTEPSAENEQLGPKDKVEDPWRQARIRFEQLYWGSLAIVEDKNVESKMVQFRGWLFENEKQIQMNTLSKELRQAGQIKALQIAKGCRTLVATSWNIHLLPLDEKDKVGN